MNVHPNQTIVKALVKGVAPSKDGKGHELDLEILKNESPGPAADFLQPQAGDRLKVFTADLAGLSEGLQIQATLALVGGPFQERTVLREAERLPIKP
jgi:hypothetical protein